MIQRAEHRYGNTFVAHPEWAAPARRHGSDLAYMATLASHLADGAEPPPMPTGKPVSVRTAVAVAYVNHSRWVADCPFCPSAQIVSPSDPRFFCAECYNGAVDGAWVKVRFPESTDAIEEALLRRPHHATRNWDPHETPADLHAETDAHLAAWDAQDPGELATIVGRPDPPTATPGT